MLQQSLPNVDSSEFYFRPTSWVISSTQNPCRIRTCKTWCTGVPFTSWFRSSKIHEGKTSDWLRRWFGDWWNDWCWSPKKKAREPISIKYLKIFAIFFWMPVDHGIGLCFIDVSKWTKLISCDSYESMNDKGHLFIFALHTRISWFVRIYRQPPKKNRWLNLKGNAPKNLPSVDVSCHLSCHSYQVGSGSMLQLRPARIMRLRRDGIQLVAAFVDQVAPTVAILAKSRSFQCFSSAYTAYNLVKPLVRNNFSGMICFQKVHSFYQEPNRLIHFEKKIHPTIPMISRGWWPCKLIPRW